MGDELDTAASTTGHTDPRAISTGKVLVTGGSGFVGRHIVRELVARGYQPVCLVRDPDKLRALLTPEQASRTMTVRGDLFDIESLDRASEGCVAAIHLVGIIMERRAAGQTFGRIHIEGTRNVVATCGRAGIRRYVHMSALGARPESPARYAQTKWLAEQAVRASDLDWTIFRPSIIHGPDGDFMRMMKFFASSRLRLPFMPYFGSGNARVQPVYVRDVATCFVRALALPETIGKVYALVGPERFTWKELYDVCARAITGRRRLKVPVPVAVGKLAALTVVPLMPSFVLPYKFDTGQVQMSQEDSIADPEPVEQTFGIRLRDFREELAIYAAQL
ncbi:MAG TPA: complex I NDUFA9 subunit family protein [Phycisphaerae bacterium]|nr:complex I NDUFA9 subunit family protein [Phycisphaerae bacterium]